MVKYLVTGGAGFIGSHVVEALVARGEAVRVVDDLSTGKRENLAGVGLEKVELIEDDLATPDVASRAVAGITHVVHIAAIPSVPRSVEDPVDPSRQCRWDTPATDGRAQRQGQACGVCELVLDLR